MACAAVLSPFFATESHADGGEWTLTSVGPWTELNSFSISQDEKYIVFSQVQADGQELAFESVSNGSGWSEAKPIATINSLGSVGGLFLSDDCRHLYFHAKASGTTDYDIYTVEREGGVWGKPRKMSDLCSSADDMSPTMAEGGQLIYFLRHQVVSDAKTERKEGGKMSIYSATLGKNGKWTRILPINPAVSFGFVQDVRLMRDGKTLLYSTRPEKKSNARPVFTRKIIAGQWLIPEFMNEDDSKDFRCIQNAGSHVYVLMHYNRKSDYYMIFRTDVDPKYSTNNVVTESGIVINKLNNRPLEATFTVLNPTTNDVIGVYTTDPTDGTYHITADPKKSYLVETRAEGFSFHSQLTEYNGKEEVLLAKTIELFDTASVGITLFDADIFQPINGKVIAVRQTDKAIFRSVKGRNGWYQLKLPLGGDYNIIATAKGFGQNSFLFKVTGDITFDHYERELSMSPVRRDVTVKIIDDETLAPISSEALFKSLDRNETINKTADAVKISLREGDKYNITVHPNGYMFANLTIDLSKDSLTEIEIPLTALRVGANLRLNNILFDTNQAFLRPESYAELDRVVRLMEENPDLNILIQAHTDNVGNNASNKRLSDRRAASAMQYLLENGVAQSRMSSIGFGATKPIADNGTEEGRQLNRRVELLITE